MSHSASYVCLDRSHTTRTHTLKNRPSLECSQVSGTQTGMINSLLLFIYLFPFFFTDLFILFIHLLFVFKEFCFRVRVVFLFSLSIYLKKKEEEEKNKNILLIPLLGFEF